MVDAEMSVLKCHLDSGGKFTLWTSLLGKSGCLRCLAWTPFFWGLGGLSIESKNPVHSRKPSFFLKSVW